MEKQDQPESLATVAVKDYPPSEVFGSEPPPAYQKPRSNAVQIARIAAGTLIAMSVILGVFILAAAYVQSHASCQNPMMHHEGGAGEGEDHPSFQQLVDPLQSEESVNAANTNRVEAPLNAAAKPAVGDQRRAPAAAASSEEEGEGEDELGGDSGESDDDDEEPQPVRIKLPLTLDFDDIAGALVERNQRSRMNCVVEKRRAEQVVDHAPRTLRLPFGLNVTTDPRYEHVSGERMAIFCESGKEQRHMPMDVMAATPVVVPLPGPVHLPLQFHGHPQAHMQAQGQMPHPQMQVVQMQALPARGGRAYPQLHPNQALQQLHQHLMRQEALKEQQRQEQMRQEQMRQEHIRQEHMRQEHIRQEQMRQEQMRQEQREQAAAAAAAAMHASMRVAEPKAVPIQVAEARQVPLAVAEARALPLHVAQHVAQLQAAAAAAAQAEARSRPVQLTEARHLPLHAVPVEETRHIPVQFAEARHIPIQVAEARHIPISEVREAEAAEAAEAAAAAAAAAGQVARQARGFEGAAPFPRLPVNVPVQLMQAVQVEQPRPHYVQPRSVRSPRSAEDVFLHKREKRMRRCACDCSC